MTTTPSNAAPRHTNRLVDETSPYLLQHAHNPVDWYPWGPEALERARSQDRLILLSIGYSACHWCHVMERESFESEAIAELMNREFVNVKVDREERPDLDEIYMAATLAMNQGQGGWPMTVFLTPDLEPVFAGTYFPPEDRWGRPGFPTLLERIAEAWRRDRDSLAADARRLTASLRHQKEAADPPLAVGEDDLRLALAQFGEDFDPRHGGFGAAPKFPPAAGLSLLLRLWRRFGDDRALEMVTGTLDGMARGGIYDQVGGGFARYSTDEKWLVPHFEKMLYDNALLAAVYLEAYQATGAELYRRVATETLDYVLREMVSPEGGVYSATDADSEGEEGKFFVWTPEETAEILGEEAAGVFNAYYDITAEGNWEGKSIPHTPRALEDLAAELGAAPERLRAILDAAREKVYRARRERVPPGLDDKVLTSWNGMMIEALARGYDVTGEARYLRAAESAADFVMDVLRRGDGGLFRTYRAGKSHLPGYLEDYAWMSEALVTLYEAGGDAGRLRQAEELAERILAEFADGESGGLFNTARGHEKLILRYREGSDGATPAPNAVAASALARLSFHLARDDFREAAVAAVRAYGRTIGRFPRAFARTLSVVDLLLEGPLELALVGRAGSAGLEALRREVAGHYLPNRIQAVHDPDALPAAGGRAAAGDGGDDVPPLLRGKTLLDGEAALYVCRDFACRSPVSDPAAVAAALGSAGGAPAATALATRLAGRASAGGTERYAAHHEGSGFAVLGTTGLTAGRLGFGAYRVGDTDGEHRAALAKALGSGVNLIDTSTNYADGASERLIGSVVRELVAAGELAREEVVVVSKIGYVQGRNYDRAQRREAEGRPFPEMVKLEDGLWHCLAPEFLEDQLRRSLDRLELECLDVCLLHNPEYFLAAEARRGEPVEKAREEFYRRLEAAFRFLEGEIAAGRVGAYGVSSNTVGAPVVVADGTSLSRMLDAARAAGGERHGFRVLQLPLNLFETGPLLEFNTGEAAGGASAGGASAGGASAGGASAGGASAGGASAGGASAGGAPAGGAPAVPALELARREKLAVLVNRPLNAFTHDGLLRLAEVTAGGEAIDYEAQLERLAELEKEFRSEIASHLRAAEGDTDADPADAFRWSEELAGVGPRLQTLDQWTQVASQVAYTVNRVAALFDQSLAGEVAARWRSFRERYFPELDRLLGELRRRLAEQAAARTAAVAAAIDPLLPAERRGATLSQKALWTVASTPGVTVVLCGMRRQEYVDDALAIRRWPDVEAVHALYQAAARVELPA